MIHIFTIHSHITYLSALGTIEYENLDSKNVILICNASYKPNLPSNFQGKIKEGLDESKIEKNILAKLIPFSYSKNAIRYIKELCSDSEYIAYIDLMSNFNKYLVFHKNCTKFNIIEEGIVNYGDYYDVNLLTSDLRNFNLFWNEKSHLREFFKGVFRLYRGRSIRMQSLPIHPNVYANFPNVNSYCFSELAFPKISPNQRKVLNLNNFKKLEDNHNKYPENSWFWIGDTAAKSYNISMQNFEKAMIDLMQKINPDKHVYPIFLKFRGPETELEKDITLRVLKEYGFKVNYLDKNSIVELIFARGNNFNVCGIVSSLLIYASNFGHKTFSTYPYIPDIYDISINKSFPVIAQKVYYGNN